MYTVLHSYKLQQFINLLCLLYGKTGAKMSYNHVTTSVQTWRHASYTDDPSPRRPLPGCLVPIVYGAGKIDQPIGHVRLRDLLKLGHSHGRCQRIVNSSDSNIHSPHSPLSMDCDSPSNAGLRAVPAVDMT